MSNLVTGRDFSTPRRVGDVEHEVSSRRHVLVDDSERGEEGAALAERVSSSKRTTAAKFIGASLGCKGDRMQSRWR
jgi:hypothetical protein